MKKLLLITVLAGFSTGAIAQQAQINAGQDDTICSGSTTLTATLGATSGTVIPLTCDDCFSGVIPIGFSFTYYGNTYTQCVVSSNNYISFNTAQANGFSPWSIGMAVPNAGNPLNAIMGPWQDVYPGLGGTIRYATIGTAPNRIFVVEYCNIPMFSCTNLNFSSQIQLFETSNIIETHIISKPLCTTWNGGKAIHATHNSNGTIAHVVPGRNNPTQWTASLEGYRWTPTSSIAYTLVSVPFSPVILGASGTISWTANGNPIGTGSSITVSPTSTTEYIASINDVCSGQTFRDTVNVVVATPFTFNGSTVTNTSCASPTGMVDLNVVNGSGTYSYQWDDPAMQTTQDAMGLDSGYYQVMVTDPILGCTRDTTFYLDNNNTIALSVDSIVDITCNGLNNGQAFTSFTGGIGPNFTVTFDNGEVGPTADSLNQGTHVATITDSDGCTSNFQFIITQPLPGQVTINSTTDVQCAGQSTGAASVQASGGSGNYTYLWNDPMAQQTANATGLPAGTWTVTATDANGCQYTNSVTITTPNAITSSITSTDITCNGLNNGTADLTVSGGSGSYSYLWLLNGSTLEDQSQMIPGTFVVQITDGNGCTHFDTVTITQPSPILMSFTSTPTECGLATGTATVTATGGTQPYNYMWTNGDITQTGDGFAIGTAGVTITDDNGCTATGSTQIGSVLTMVAGVGSDVVTGVFPLTVNFTNTTTGGATYDIDFGDGTTPVTGATTATQTHTFVEPGTYIVMLVAYNAGGCTDTSYITIIVIEESMITMPNVFSPNGDGTNDEFKPIFTQALKSYQINIFNRWGHLVFEGNDVNNGWKGTNNGGGDCPDGTYYYVVVAVGVDEVVHELKGNLNMFRKN